MSTSPPTRCARQKLFVASAIDKGPHIIGLAIKSSGGVKAYPFVSPSKLAGEFRNRHQLNDGDAEILEFRKLFGRRGPGSLGSKRSDVHLVDDLAGRFNAAPG